MGRITGAKHILWELTTETIVGFLIRIWDMGSENVVLVSQG
jgi:hypothetical protein